MSPVHDREPAVGASRLTVFHELALEKCGDYTSLQPTEVTLGVQEWKSASVNRRYRSKGSG